MFRAAAVLFALATSSCQRPTMKTFPILVAAKPLAKGVVLTRSDVRVEQVTETFDTTDALRPPELDSVIGATVVTPIDEGRPLHPYWFSAKAQ